METIDPKQVDGADAPETTFEKRETLTWFVTVPPQRRFAITAVIRRDGEAYSAFVPLLPGGFSCGDTLEDAKVNIREAVNLVIESYLENEGYVPWRDTPEFEGEPSDDDTLFAFAVDV